MQGKSKTKKEKELVEALKKDMKRKKSRPGPKQPPAPKPPKPPAPKKTLSPRYPDICKTAGVEGRVVLEFYIDETGKVDQSSVSILSSVPCLDQVCLNEIKKSKWKPARQGKEKVGVYLTKTFNFTLEQAN